MCWLQCVSKHCPVSMLHDSVVVVTAPSLTVNRVATSGVCLSATDRAAVRQSGVGCMTDSAAVFELRSTAIPLGQSGTRVSCIFMCLHCAFLHL